MAVAVINMIPNSASNELQRDSEPNITATFLDRSQIAASVFTPDPLGSGNAPIYISIDGGNTWTFNVVLPGGNKTNDTTLRFAGPSNVLYAGILRTDNGNLQILRKANFTAAGLMDVLVTKTNDDQPYVEGAVVMAGSGTGADRVYVGENDFAPGSKTATVDLSLDAATAPAPAGFGSNVIEVRTTSGQDGPPIRPAVHLDGTVYAVFMGWRSATTTDVVVVRDDNWGSGGTPFTSLKQAGVAGQRVATATSRVALGTLLGTQRVGGQCAIAVDPRDSSVVYVAWADGTTGANQTIHVKHSTDRGVTWDAADIRTIAGATNPALAINQFGVVGFLYQQLHDPGSGNRWNTRFESWNASLGSPTNVSLADVPDANGMYAGPNPIGDYAGLIAVGKNFYGIFCANNTPDNTNFPSGVTYQRNANFTTHTLLDLANNPVAVSIDPFFVNVTTVEATDDFYVRDWTDSPTSGDNGVEPSTHPQFYVNSDVWNRRGTLPGGFANDQPDNESAGNGAGNVGDNWAFARVRRNVASAGPQNVTAHFLVSKFGTGSAYVDATSGDPDVTFIDPDPIVPFAATDLGPFNAGPVQWHLGAIASTHLCLAVEISGPNDPFVPPSLLGNTPGWPTTDLRIINDNNKAQRNMGLSTTPARGAGASDLYYAIVRNAATFPRDFELRYSVDRNTLTAFRGATIEVVGGEPVRLAGARGGIGTIRLARMKPGENRWIGLRFPAAVGTARRVLTVNFEEVLDGVVVNGFAIGARLGAIGDVLREKLDRHRSEMTRFDALGVELAAESAKDAYALATEKRINPNAYLRFVSESRTALESGIASLKRAAKSFDLPSSLDALGRALRSKDVARVAVAHDALLNGIDAAITMQQLENGDVANILHNVRWQYDLFRTVPNLSGLACAVELLAGSNAFIQAHGRRERTNADYSKLLAGQLACLRETARALGDSTLLKSLEEVKGHIGGNLAGLQRAHQSFLERLDSAGRKTVRKRRR
jgi:hypothetical protein